MMITTKSILKSPPKDCKDMRLNTSVLILHKIENV